MAHSIGKKQDLIFSACMISAFGVVFCSIQFFPLHLVICEGLRQRMGCEGRGLGQ